MRVDWHSCLSEGYGLHNIGGLATYSRQAQQTVEIARHLATIIVDKHTRQLYEMTGFGVGIANTLYVLVDLKLVGFGHRMGIGKVSKQFGRNLVDTLVGALRTEHNGYKQLEDARKLQLGGGVAVDGAQVVEHMAV